MKFIDEASIDVRGGKGGDGCVSFRREKFVPRGGPDGGDGGRGGDVVFIADPNKATLLDQRYKRAYVAPRGKNGGPSNRTGASGEDLVVPVPPGTLLYEEPGGALLVDMAEPGARFVVASGGRGGRGNSRFMSSKQQAPRRADDGGPGEERTIRMELKLLADVGLIGLPNAGKSTLIRRISASQARVADYPFTTLVPNLGVVSVGGERSYVVADVPGLIEGAAAGAGLGHRFLRHVERAQTLVHIVALAPEGDSSATDPLDAWEMIEAELRAYSESLARKPRLIVLNKVDLISDPETVERVVERFPKEAGPVFIVSAVSGDGLSALVDELTRRVLARRGDHDGRPPEPTIR